jgi:hypothetical protein
MPPYNPYYNQQMYNPMMNAQQRLAQMEMQYPQYGQQSMFPTQISGSQMSLSGRIVDSFGSITANDVPMDNSGAIFVKRDNSEIQHRIWNADGTIKTTSYKPILANFDSNTKNLSLNEEKLKFALSDEATEGIMNRFDTLESKIESLESILGKKRSVKRNDKSNADDVSAADE